MPGISIFAMQENVLNIFNELENENAWLAENAGKPAVAMDEIRKHQARQKELQERHDIAAAALGAAQDRQRAKIAENGGVSPTQETAKQQAVTDRAQFYRAVASGDMAAARKITNKLGAIPEGSSAGLGTGENLLPTNMSNELIYEPLDDNPMRAVVPISQITNLEMPKIAYTLDDDAFIDDKTVAKEMQLSGDKVTFGRFKSKVKVKISDTVLYGTETALVNYVNNALQAGLAAKEKKVMFATTPTVGEEHMSFYSTATGLTKIEKPTLYDAIVGALGDLNDMFANNAKIVMRRADYLDMIKSLANGSATLWGAKPEDILGVPVIFCDKATTPVVGDFRYYHLNYDIGTRYDSDKDVDSGDSIFVLTAWLDAQFLLKSAFRLAAIKTT